MKGGVCMEIKEKVNEIAKLVGDKASEMMEIGKLNAKVYSENGEVDALKKQLGEICFGKYRAGDELDPEIEEICIRIEKHKRNIAEIQRTLAKMKNTQKNSGTIDMTAAGFCPYCGMELVKNARFCAGCGKEIL